MDANEVEEGTTKPIFELEADLGAYSLGYFRIPREDNILYFNGQALNSEWALAWAKNNLGSIKTSGC